MSEQMTYAGVGVDYEAMDPFKRMCQLAGRDTADQLKRFGFTEAEWSRGESCYLIEAPGGYLAHVEEGLGTKNLVADAMALLALAQQVEDLAGKSFYDQVAQCTVAMIVNDMITLGALPVSVAMHLATGESEWFNNKRRCQELVDGWKKACLLSRCAWGGGETPTLKGIIVSGTALLSGSAIGLIRPKTRVIQPRIEDGDAIILFASSGIHANGLTLARKIADNLPDGYLTQLDDSRSYGEALLDPTIIYVPLVEECLNAGVDIHYAVNVTGHGWRKLMRADGLFNYVIEQIPEPQLVFHFIQEHGPVDDREAYGNLNMGAGFALYVPTDEALRVIDIAGHCGLTAMEAGFIETSGEKRVIIEPKRIVFTGSELGVR